MKIDGGTYENMCNRFTMSSKSEGIKCKVAEV